MGKKKVNETFTLLNRSFRRVASRTIFVFFFSFFMFKCARDERRVWVCGHPLGVRVGISTRLMQFRSVSRFLN